MERPHFRNSLLFVAGVTLLSACAPVEVKPELIPVPVTPTVSPPRATPTSEPPRATATPRVGEVRKEEDTGLLTFTDENGKICFVNTGPVRSQRMRCGDDREKALAELEKP